MGKNKKIAAALSAVISYIREEEEVIHLQTAEKSQPVSSAITSLNQWGLSGRQAIMQMRNLMQMKAFHGLTKKP